MKNDYDLRAKVAISCRILGMLGLMRESTGHVSARIPGTDEMWIRCRGGDELGLTYTGLHNVRRVDFDGNGPGLGDEHAAPHEVAIHGEIYRARKDVSAVVHAHPYYALMCGVTRLEYRPIFGGYEPSALDIVLKGVPIFPRAATVTDKHMAAQMLECMGERDVVLMKGHGITVTAGSVEQATALAIRFDRLSKIMWDVALSGRDAPELGPEDMDRYDRRDRAEKDKNKPGWKTKLKGSETWAWKHYVKQLETENIGLPTDMDAE
jgi:ribulose-5-phosphate 4-epimerase/fuculose-1-phosphate aldolase